MKDEAIFQAIRSYLMTVGLTKFSKYFKGIAKDVFCVRKEITHYILERGGCLDIPTIPAPKTISGKDIISGSKAVVKQYFDIIVCEGEDVAKIYIEALAQDDVFTLKWMKPIIVKAIDMEAEARELLAEINFCKTEIDVWAIDQHLKY